MVNFTLDQFGSRTEFCTFDRLRAAPNQMMPQYHLQIHTFFDSLNSQLWGIWLQVCKHISKAYPRLAPMELHTSVTFTSSLKSISSADAGLYCNRFLLNDRSYLYRVDSDFIYIILILLSIK